jgi:flavin reductase (DIM6/NTAB) family NADH-FMN oxidoreductase RutF
MKDIDPHKQLASALGRIPSGLFVLTFEHQGSETGLLLSWVQQCSFDPPRVTLALKKGRSTSEPLGESVRFVLNVLHSTQTDMVAHFGKGFPAGEPAFEGIELERSPGGLPVLAEALAYLECRVERREPAGDHDLVIAEVLAGKMLGDGHPMVHVRKSGMHY